MKIVIPILKNCLVIHERFKSRILCFELNAAEKYNVLERVFEAARDESYFHLVAVLFEKKDQKTKKRCKCKDENRKPGEDMDACLEEVNKDSKVWQHGSMVALHWLRIFRNLGNLCKVRNWLFTMIGLQNPKEEAIESRRKYDFGDEVLAWRIKLRKERYLEGNCSERLISLDGLELDKDLPNYEEILQNNWRKLLSEHFIDGKKRTEVKVQRLYVTVQERAAAEDINNATKEEILKRIEDKLQQIFDEEVRGPLSSKLEYFKAHPSKAKKEALLVLYNDIIEELQHLEPVDKNCIVEDGEDGEVD